MALFKDPIQEILDAVNAQNNQNFTTDDLTFSLPYAGAFTDPDTGQLYDTKVTVNTVDPTVLKGTTTVYYNRLVLNEIAYANGTSAPLAITCDSLQPTQYKDFLGDINKNWSLTLTADDITNGTLADGSVVNGRLTKTGTLVASSNSLRWQGSIDLVLVERIPERVSIVVTASNATSKPYLGFVATNSSGTITGTIDFGDGVKSKNFTFTVLNDKQVITPTVPLPQGNTQITFYDFPGLSFCRDSKNGVSNLPSNLILELVEYSTNGFENQLYLFQSQTSLTTIRENAFANYGNVPTFSNSNAGYQLFKGCTKLTQLPTVIFPNGYYITSIREIFYGNAFVNYTVPSTLFNGLTNCADFGEIFYNAGGVVSIPGDLFAQCPNATKVDGIFYATKISVIPEGIFDPLTKLADANTAFGNTDVTVIPGDLFKNNPLLTNVNGCFMMLDITSIPGDLFSNNANLATAEGCFSNCDYLTDVPETLFQGHTKLTSLYQLFYSDNRLTEIPTLFLSGCSALTNLSFMFESTGLAEIPAGLFDSCVNAQDFTRTFVGCPLTTIPKGLFDHCPNVTTFALTFASSGVTAVDEDLFKYNTKVTTFGGTFGHPSWSSSKGNGLKTIPVNLFANNPNVTTFAGTFQGCMDLVEVPVGLFDHQTKVTDFSTTFQDCNSLVTIPETLFYTNPNVTTFAGVFGFDLTSSSRRGGQNQITEIPAGIFAGQSKVVTMDTAFSGTRITALDADLFKDMPLVNSAKGLFAYCTELVEVPTGLFSHWQRLTFIGSSYTSYNPDTSMFSHCTSLTTLPENMFPAAPISDIGYVFAYCESLAEIPADLFGALNVNYMWGTFMHSGLTEIPDGFASTWTGRTGSLKNTFEQCTALTTVPAGWLALWAKVSDLTQVFDGCSALTTSIQTMLPADTVLSASSLNYLFRNCSALTGSGNVMIGQFSKPPSNFTDVFLNCTSLDDYADIPSTWK